jgi:hypothetical protein
MVRLNSANHKSHMAILFGSIVLGMASRFSRKANYRSLLSRRIRATVDEPRYRSDLTLCASAYEVDDFRLHRL